MQDFCRNVEIIYTKVFGKPKSRVWIFVYKGIKEGRLGGSGS